MPSAAPIPALQQLDNITFLETENEHLIAYLKRTRRQHRDHLRQPRSRGAARGRRHVPPELGLPAAFDVSDLLGDAVFTWRAGQQLRPPRAGPAAGAPAARRVVTREARAPRSCAQQRWFGAKSRRAGAAGASSTPAPSRPAAPWRCSRPPSPTARASSTSCPYRARASDGAIELVAGRSGARRALLAALRGRAALATGEGR